MKIAISTSVIQRGSGALSQYVLSLVKALLPHAERHDFFLLVLEDDLPLFSFAAGRMNLVPVREKYRPAVKDIAWHQTVLPRLLKRLEMDVLHVPTYRRMLWSAPCGMVATIHDLAQFRIKAKYDFLRMVYAQGAARYLARSQDEIIAISQSTADDIKIFFKIPLQNIHVIHHGVDSERFFPSDSAQAKGHAAARWALNEPFFLYVSRLEYPAKNHVRLIEAFSRFRASSTMRYQLVFVGKDAFRSEVIRAAARISAFAKDIIFLGFVEDGALPTLYRAAEALVYPSLFEGFGQPPVEAMACGCPVLTSTRGSLAEVVGGSAGIFEPEDVEEIAATLNRVATDLGWRASLRSAGIVNARRFNWSENAERVLSVYGSAVKRNRASRTRALRARVRLTHTEDLDT
jgi:glycosyltransferase involved in cell wall biosynthesis